MLLVFPPVARPCEPPAGIARLSAALGVRRIPHALLDANLEGLLWLLEQPREASDTWTRRALKNRVSHLEALREPLLYASRDRYARAVSDLDRLLSVASAGVAGLADYQHRELSPLRSADLVAAAKRFRENPFHPWFSRRLDELLQQGNFRTVGFSLNYLSQALCTFAMIGFLRSRHPSLRIVLGGGLVTSWTASPGWRNPFGGLVDAILPGRGEEALPEFLGGGEGEREPGAPRYGELPLERYLSPGMILPYSAAGGCWWNRCSFCPEPAEGNPYHPLPAGRVLRELTALTEEHRPALVHLLDSAVSPALLRALAEEGVGAPWYGFARIGGELADPEFCRRLRRSGCVMLKLGLESGDQGVLDRLEKGIDLGIASRVLHNLRDAGIATYVYLLFGTPPETEEGARRTLEFTARHAECIGFLNLALFNMPLSAAGAHATTPFYDADLSLYTGFHHPAGWERRRVRSFVEKEFSRHPAIAPIVRSDPPVFTSNHAAFFAPGILPRCG